MITAVFIGGPAHHTLRDHADNFGPDYVVATMGLSSACVIEPDEAIAWHDERGHLRHPDVSGWHTYYRVGYYGDIVIYQYAGGQ